MMTARTIMTLTDQEVLATVSYMDLEGLREQSSLTPDDAVYQQIEKGFLYGQSRGWSQIIAIWPDGVFGFVPVVPLAPSLLPAFKIDPAELINVYRDRFSVIYLGGVSRVH